MVTAKPAGREELWAKYVDTMEPLTATSAALKAVIKAVEGSTGRVRRAALLGFTHTRAAMLEALKDEHHAYADWSAVAGQPDMFDTPAEAAGRLAIHGLPAGANGLDTARRTRERKPGKDKPKSPKAKTPKSAPVPEPGPA